MDSDIIPEDVREFILQNIDSIAQMEALILVRADPQAEWDAASISRALYVDEEKAAELLSHMAERGLFLLSGTKGHYKCNTLSPEMEILVGRVVDSYREYLLPMTHLIHSNFQTRIQKFADAFILKKEKD
jgi:hypothetical protein